ncbi:MAG: hypothetical protein Q4C70_01180 [Planctomycetia bacterium]|nr:hypothetical protein [Planctomycetia bacterium]
MKKNLVILACVFAGAMGCSLFAEEYGANDYTGETAVVEASNAAPSEAAVEEADGVKCFWGWRCWRRYYYRPVCYYYRPVVWTYTYRPVYTYAYSCVTFYKSMDAKSATEDTGILMTATPEADTPLAAHGIVKGDVITHIDGKAITHPSQIDKITANSDLVVVKVNGKENAENAVAPSGAPEVSYEYGAFEY